MTECTKQIAVYHFDCAWWTRFLVDSFDSGESLNQFVGCFGMPSQPGNTSLHKLGHHTAFSLGLIHSAGARAASPESSAS
jgi:hypothetical protein